ncbi:hypothetical protein [Crocosphaera chwakensis]|uniref:SLH domain-containing protein n=1 Tax=Crocosphaera chwakensis CCY0110 TaxID=391612 RepID=A3ILJ3_9CHRO|nr:hypothetical protein [Crocosphaera chwakensis]EAZ92644.1 hypothetical protein CY0110_23796 [Crocosphaera chwakensis CCY0110]
MSKTAWKVLSWFLSALLTISIALFGIPFTHQGLLAQNDQTFTCGNPTDWSFEAIRGMVERYELDTKFVCGKGTFQVNNPDVRADIAEWITGGLKANEKILEEQMQVISQEIETLQKSYIEISKSYGL